MKKVYFITDYVIAKGKRVRRYNFAHCYNKHIIGSTRQGYSRLADAEKTYNNNFKPGAKRFYVTRQEFKALFD